MLWHFGTRTVQRAHAIVLVAFSRAVKGNVPDVRSASLAGNHSRNRDRSLWARYHHECGGRYGDDGESAGKHGFPESGTKRGGHAEHGPRRIQDAHERGA